MTKKLPVQNFEDFKGEDVTSSPLRIDPLSAIRMQNLEKLENGSLRGREGIKLVAQPYPISQIFTYFNQEQAAEELIGFGSASRLALNANQGAVSIFKLATDGAFEITYSGANDWGYSMLPDLSGDGYTFTITENGSTVLSQDLGNGYESTPYTIKELADAINALTGFTCSSPKTAVVNGNQTATTITVDSGHTLAREDWAEIAHTCTAFTGGTVHQIEILDTAATTITLNTEVAITVSDNAIFGHGNYPAVILDMVDVAEDSYTDVSIPYSHWVQVQYLLNIADTVADSVTRTDILNTFDTMDYRKAPVSFANHRSVVYFTHKDIDKVTNFIYSPSTSEETDGYKDINTKYFNGVYKYDGYRVRMHHCPHVDAPGVTGITYDTQITVTEQTSSSSPLPAGNYRYRWSVCITDAQNNEVCYYSPYSLFYTSLGADSTVIGIPNPCLTSERFHLHPRRFGIISAALTSIASSTTSLAITSGHQFRTGDYVYITNSSDNFVHKRRVTASTLAGVTIDSSISAASGSIISTAKVSIWRSKVNTSSLYLQSERPYEVKASASPTRTSVDDDVTDDELGIILTSVAPDQTQYPFPPANSIAVVQGGLVVGGGSTETYQQVHWEDADAPESSPRAISNSRIPTRVSGDIQSIIESKYAGVNIFKPLAQYTATGEFPSNTVEILKDLENSYGVENFWGITDVENILYGVNRQGIWARIGEEVSEALGRVYDKYFYERPLAEDEKIRFLRSKVFYDPLKKWVYILLPAYDDTFISSGWYTLNSNSRLIVLDIKNACWGEHVFTTDQYPNGGMAVANNTFYMQTCTLKISGVRARGYLHKRLHNELSDKRYDYHDNGSSYDYDLLTAWDDNGDPDSYKPWFEFVLYSLQPDYFIDAFTIKFESYRDWKETTAKRDTQRLTTLSFPDSTTQEKKIQFDKGYKSKRRNIRLYGTIELNPPVMSGYQFTIDEDLYAPDRMTRP